MEERIAYSRAVRVKSLVVQGSVRTQWPDHTRFTFSYVFKDAHGGRHTAWFSHIQLDVPRNIQQVIKAEQFPIAVDILYDPDWPGRSWLAEAEYSDNERLFLYSLMTLLFSTMLTFALMYMNQHCRWVPPPGTGPFFGMMVVLLMAGWIQGD